VVTQAGSESAALVHVVDIFATAADLAGVQLDRLLDPNGDRLVIDGRSLLPCLRSPQDCTSRDYLYTEQFKKNGKPPYLMDERAVRDRRWKLIRRKNAPEEFFDLEGRRDDGPNLLSEPLDEEARTAYKRLTAELDRLTEEIVYAGY
jgi:arylsulfatase A-like enzyme